jgi:hypothetical protein
LDKGVNELVVLADNLGRLNYGMRIGEQKGLFGQVYDAKPLRTRKFKLKACEGYSRRVLPRTHLHLQPRLESLAVWSAEVDISLKSVTPIHLSFTDIPHDLAIFCNERPVGFFDRYHTNWGDVTLGPELTKGKNKLRIMLWGDVDEASLGNIRFHQLTECLSDEGSWAWRPWQRPINGRSAKQNAPATYQATFKAPVGNDPLFVELAGCKKGQLYLNGQDCGRYWTLGPQKRWYLPSCWLEEENELHVFDELGRKPSRCSLKHCPTGPFHD